MARKVRNTFLYVVVLIIFFCISLYSRFLHPYSIPLSIADHHLRSLPPSPLPPLTNTIPSSVNRAISEYLTTKRIPSLVARSPPSLSTVSVLLPAWEVLVVVSPDDTPSAIQNGDADDYVCLYPNNEVSPAKPAGMLQFPDRATFKCQLPNRSRQRLPFLQPVLTKTPTDAPERISPAPELLRWTNVAYDSLTTDEDVVLFLKGVNNRQGFNREPSGFRCVFFRGDDVANGVRTAVTSSMQEVFRCQLPELTSVPSSDGEERVKVTLEIVQDKRVVPTLTYYAPVRKLGRQNGKSLICACTMVYNVAKFLKEWVAYHSRIGIDKFILYDNESDDNLEKAVEELIKEGYDVETYFWLWPKTQEAGFSHSALYAKDSCTWMAYIDVDEFIYSPSWLNSTMPSKSMLNSLLQDSQNSPASAPAPAPALAPAPLGQVSFGCHEFGPSNQSEHPVMGVTQGYNCRRQYENRHKSIVLLDAIDDSLLNVIHHFIVKPGYRSVKFNIQDMAVNHYKFQAWPEFKAKFRRRVSAYVVDWTQQVNPNSNDRTPGLGYSAVEPESWPQKFCEVQDDGLKDLTRKWFSLESASGYKMAWQRR